MGGGAGDVYESPNYQAADQLGFDQIISMISGAPINESPALNSSYVAQSLGGTYDPKTENIKLPDGSIIRYDVATGEFVGTGDKTAKYTSKYDQYSKADGKKFSSPQEMENYVKGGGVVYEGQASKNGGGRRPVSIDPLDFQGGNEWASRANEIYTSSVKPIYGENSAYQQFGNDAFGKKTYDPVSGTYVDASTPGVQQLTGDYYLSKFGDYLNDPYSQFQYQEASPYTEKEYNQFNYESPTIQGVDNISRELVDKQISRATDDVFQGAQAKRSGIEDFIASSGGSINGGRAARLMMDVNEEANREAAIRTDELETQNALRMFNDATSVRDQQAAQNMRVQELKGAENRAANEQKVSESRFGYDSARDENRQKQTVAQEEARKAFDTGQEQGKQKLSIAAAADTDQANRAAQQNQANTQNSLNRFNALQGMLNYMAGQDATQAQLDAAAMQAQSSAMAGVMGAASNAASAI